MKPTVPSLSISALALLSAVFASAQAQRQPPTPAQAITQQFVALNKGILAMAQDFPESKYDYRPGEGVRSFGEVIVHIVGGNIYGAKAGRGENVQWGDVDPKNYKTKAEIVALLQKSIDDATATLKATPAESFAKTVEPWLSVTEHSAEHYGQLVAYYRVNGLLHPQSRPKPKTN